MLEEEEDNFSLSDRECDDEIKSFEEDTEDKFDNKESIFAHQEQWSTNSLVQMVTNMWKKTQSTEVSEVYAGLNYMLELLLGYHCPLRGDSSRLAELSDTYFEVKDTPRGKLPMLVFQLYHEKGMHRQEIPGCVGTCLSKDVRECLVSAYAFSLWFRFDSQIGPNYGENLAAFLDKKSWDPVEVLFSTQSKNNEVSEDYENKLMKNCLESVGFDSNSIKKFLKEAKNSNTFEIDENVFGERYVNDTTHGPDPMLSPFPFSLIH